MKLLVCGSRAYTNHNFIYEKLDNYLSAGTDLIIIHGSHSTGADNITHQWCQAHPAVYELAIPAKWRLYGKFAGPRRNRVMAQLNPDIALAFCQPGARNRGTTDMVSVLNALSVPVRVFMGDRLVAG